MWNPYKRLKALIPGQPEQIGQVVDIDTTGVIVQLPTGFRIRARGEAALGDRVYVKDGSILGPAPVWTGLEQDV